MYYVTPSIIIYIKQYTENTFVLYCITVENIGTVNSILHVIYPSIIIYIKQNILP